MLRVTNIPSPSHPPTGLQVQDAGTITSLEDGGGPRSSSFKAKASLGSPPPKNPQTALDLSDPNRASAVEAQLTESPITNTGKESPTVALATQAYLRSPATQAYLDPPPPGLVSPNPAPQPKTPPPKPEPAHALAPCQAPTLLKKRKSLPPSSPGGVGVSKAALCLLDRDTQEPPSKARRSLDLFSLGPDAAQLTVHDLRMLSPKYRLSCLK